MSAHEQKGIVRIDLTPEQKEKVKAATGSDVEALDLSVELLEQRIAPLTRAGIIMNHNDSFLIE